MQDNQLAIIAIVAALALFGVVMVTVAVTMQLQEADAQRGCPVGTPAPNASKGRCFKG
jgi:hypothetical protein